MATESTEEHGKIFHLQRHGNPDYSIRESRKIPNESVCRSELACRDAGEGREQDTEALLAKQFDWIAGFAGKPAPTERITIFEVPLFH
jgi:hypothetical protein